MPTKWKAFTHQDFCSMFGCDTLPEACTRLIDSDPKRWSYRFLDKNETWHKQLEIIKEMSLGNLYKAGTPEARTHWEQVWVSSLADISHSPLTLKPPYLKRKADVIRWERRFIKPSSNILGSFWYDVFLQYLADTVFKDYHTLYEFGCGSGYNLSELLTWYPNKQYHGLDWVQPSVDICQRLRNITGTDIQGHLFDCFHPDHSLKLESGSLVFTVGALEQTGDRWKPFIEYLRQSKAGLFVHIEPIFEFYNEGNPVDATAMQYHRARGYLTGLLPYLRNLELNREVEILKQHRTGFGSRYIEGYSQIIWRNKR